jgi:hypothetical protein
MQLRVGLCGDLPRVFFHLPQVLHTRFASLVSPAEIESAFRAFVEFPWASFYSILSFAGAKMHAFSIYFFQMTFFLWRVIAIASLRA